MSQKTTSTTPQNKPGPGYSPQFPTPPIPLPTIPEILHSAYRSIFDPHDPKNPKHMLVRYGSDGETVEFAQTRVHSHFRVIFGPHVKASDAYAAHFVSQNTTIPVQKTYAVLYDPDTKFTFIVYEYLEDATQLSRLWTNKKFKNKCIATIAGYVKQLRSIPSPGWFGTVDGKLITDPFASGKWFNPDLKEYPPACTTGYGWVHTLLNTMQTMHGIGPTRKKWLTDVMHAALDPSSGPEQAVFTHPTFGIGSFFWRDSDKTIVWADWFGAGFAPKYWQYCTVMARSPPKYVESETVIWHRILEPFLLEYAWVDKYYSWLDRGK